MTNEDIKHNFSENLIKLRKAKNLTQLELAEKLNYSDKAISKWEVGSVLPDVETMTHIAEFFGITVNDLIYAKKRNVLREFYKTHLFMTLLVSVSLWFIATIIFFVLDIFIILKKSSFILKGKLRTHLYSPFSGEPADADPITN